MVAADLVKTFSIQDPQDYKKTYEVEMTVLDYIKYKQIQQLISVIRGING